MYWNEILWILTWPVLIVVSYQTIRFLLKKYEARIEGE
jgi:hypothetical protein